MNREERRSHILDCAREVFSERGYHATTVSDIIGRANVARGTFYLYFKSKRAIFDVLLDDFFVLMMSKVKRVDLSSKERVYDQMYRNIDGIVEILLENRELAKILLSEAVGLDPGFDAKLLDFYGRLLRIIQGSMAQGIQMNLLRPFNTRLTGACALGTVKEALYQIIMSNERPAKNVLVGEIMMFIFYGIYQGRPEDQLLSDP